MDFSWNLLEINGKRKTFDAMSNAVTICMDLELTFSPSEVDQERLSG